MSNLLPAGTREEAVLARLPGKQKLIKLSWRPPNYEAPIETFADAVTPNDRFFVRYHLAGIPEKSKLGNWSLRVRSLDYIPMNSPFLTPERWRADVTKMRQAYGAPIDDATANTIIRYLSKHYAVPPKA